MGPCLRRKQKQEGVRNQNVLYRNENELKQRKEEGKGLDKKKVLMLSVVVSKQETKNGKVEETFGLYFEFTKRECLLTNVQSLILVTLLMGIHCVFTKIAAHFLPYVPDP